MVLVGSRHCCVSNNTSFKKVIAKDCLTPTQKWRCYVVNSASKKAHYQIMVGWNREEINALFHGWTLQIDYRYLKPALAGLNLVPIISRRRQKKMAILAKNIVDCIFKVHDREIRLLIRLLRRACKLWEQIRFFFHMHRSLVVWCSWTNAIWLC